jgi:SOS-response transcriptional repressor LexA
VGAFRDGWPGTDIDVVRPEALRAHINDMVASLGLVVGRLARRLQWAMDQIRRLNIVREKQGTLDPEDDALFKRCDAVVKKLRGATPRTRRDAEGYDDVNTFGVLAAEGFLPGYGLDVGTVVGSAEIPFWRTGAMAFDLPRASSVALREYVPGNLIYANGHKFVARRFHRDAREETADMPVFEISTQRQAARQIATGAVPGGLGSTVLKTIAVCDVDLVHQSHISDEEDLRFQMGVATYGLERDQHNGGRAYKWGEQSLHRRRGVRLRLVNVGSSSAITRLQRFGYPICAVCGYSISPVSSERQHEQFVDSHKDRCGRAVEPLGFYADVVADVLSLPACPDQKTAYSVLEALRFAAAAVLDMHMDDLQVLVVGHVDRDEVDGLLWDPMPGGSGLIDQICERFDEIARVAKEVVGDCPSLCGTSCVDCLQTFRNGYYHAQLDRMLASEKLEAWGASLSASHEIPPKQPSSAPAEGSHPVNEAERRLRQLLLAAGFEEGVRGKQIRLDPAIGTTTPDIIYKAAHHGEQEGICIYLDGLSGHLHGSAATAAKDQIIRGWLRNNEYEVIEITVGELHDAGAMVKHFKKLAGYLGDMKRRELVTTDSSWFARAEEKKGGARGALRLVRPRPEDKFTTCVPVLPFSIAAGEFGERMESSEWVEVKGRRLSKGMFVAQVRGHSMEPRIPDGAYCLFEGPVVGSRQGRNVLVELTDRKDPETGERFTLKRYESEKATSDDGIWRHSKITLKPLNSEFSPIELTAEDEDSVRVIAEFIEVVSE